MSERGRPKNILVAEAVENFLRSKGLRATPHYIATISGFMRTFVAMYGHRRVNSLTIDDMEKYAVYLQRIDVKFADHPNRPPVEARLSKATIDSHHRTLRAFFNWMIQRKDTYRVTSNPMLEIPKPRIFESDMRVKRVEWQTYTHLLEFAKTLEPIAIQARALALLYLLPDTGCRAEGICNLRWDDVDLPFRRAYVVEKFDKGRHVFFMSNTRARLEWWKRQAPQTDYVFCSLRDRDLGSPLTTSGLYQIIIGLSEKAGLPREKWVSPHDLRHMFATYADQSGIPIDYLQALMGHEKRETTARYIHRSPDTLQHAHDMHSPMRLLTNKPEERR